MTIILDIRCVEHRTVAHLLLQMSRCEHGQKISKFCITEHCHHREASGCDYCIKKYHFHLTNTQLLGEMDIDQILKTLTLPQDSKYKCRSYNEGIVDYLRSLRQIVNAWIDAAQNAITERLAYPLLKRQGLLPVFQRLKAKDYRKVNAKDLKALNDFAKNASPQAIRRQEIDLYFKEVDWAWKIVESSSKFGQEINKLPQIKEGEGSTQLPSLTKITELFHSIKKEKDRRDNSIAKSQSRPKSSTKKELQSKSDKGEEAVDSALIKKLTTTVPLKPRELTPQKRQNIRDTIDRQFSSKQKEERQKATVSNDQSIKIQKIEIPKPQSNEEKVKRLKRRRSSIDEQFIEGKFGVQDQVNKQAEDRKKRMIETIAKKGASEEEEKDKALKSFQEGDSTKHEVKIDTTINSVKEDESAKSKLVHQCSFKTNNSRDRNTLEVNNPLFEKEKSQSSSNKVSEPNLFDLLIAKGLNIPQILINNILPPLPPTAPKNTNDTVLTNRVVKIPMGTKEINEEIQSPIFKNKRKFEKSHNANGGFMITLNPADASYHETGQVMSTVPQADKEETQPDLPLNKANTLPNQEQKIVLQLKEKNSLLLFCEALKSESVRAIQLLRASLRYSPNNLSAAEYLSYLYLENGHAKQCLQVCESILVMIEDKSQEFEVTLHLHNNKAAALNMLGRYSESIVVLEKCLKYRRKHYFYKNLGDAYFSLGIPEKAAMNYDKAVRLDPGYDEAYYNLSVTQFIQEEYSSAKLNIEMALKIDSQNHSYVQLSDQINKRLENIMK